MGCIPISGLVLNSLICCFVGGTGTVASWGWLSKSWIINRVAWNTASVDDLQYFERAVKSSGFDKTAVQWQQLYGSCLCPNICCANTTKYERRIRIARRRVHDGNRLPPWGRPLIEGDANPRQSDSPTIKRDEEEIRNLLSKVEYVNSPVLDQLRQVLENKCRKRPLKATRLTAEADRLEAEAQRLSSEAIRRVPGGATIAQAHQAQEDYEWARKCADHAIKKADMALRLHQYAQEMKEAADLAGPRRPGAHMGHFIPCLAGECLGGAGTASGAPGGTPGGALGGALGGTPSVRSATTAPPIRVNPGPGVPGPAGGDQASLTRSRPSRGQSESGRSDSGTTPSGMARFLGRRTANPLPRLSLDSSQNLDNVTPRTSDLTRELHEGGADLSQRSRLGVVSAAEAARARGLTGRDQPFAGVTAVPSSASLSTWNTDWHEEQLATVASAGSLEEVRTRRTPQNSRIARPSGPAPAVIPEATPVSTGQPYGYTTAVQANFGGFAAAAPRSGAGAYVQPYGPEAGDAIQTTAPPQMAMHGARPTNPRPLAPTLADQYPPERRLSVRTGREEDLGPAPPPSGSRGGGTGDLRRLAAQNPAAALVAKNRAAAQASSVPVGAAPRVSQAQALGLKALGLAAANPVDPRARPAGDASPSGSEHSSSKDSPKARGRRHGDGGRGPGRGGDPDPDAGTGGGQGTSGGGGTSGAPRSGAGHRSSRDPSTGGGETTGGSKGTSGSTGQQQRRTHGDSQTRSGAASGGASSSQPQRSDRDTGKGAVKTRIQIEEAALAERRSKADAITPRLGTSPTPSSSPADSPARPSGHPVGSTSRTAARSLHYASAAETPQQGVSPSPFANTGEYPGDSPNRGLLGPDRSISDKGSPLADSPHAPRLPAPKPGKVKRHTATGR